MLSMWEALGWNTSIEEAQIVYFIPDLNGNTPHFQVPREILKDYKLNSLKVEGK